MNQYVTGAVIRELREKYHLTLWYFSHGTDFRECSQQCKCFSEYDVAEILMEGCHPIK